MDKLEAEMAKAAGQIVVDTAKDSRKAIGVLLGDAVREFGLTLGDKARFFRFKNLVKIMDRVEEIGRDRGFTPEQMKALPFGEAVRVIEAASDEDEEEVQELWSRLIANASTPASGVSARKVYIDLLKSLSPSEAVFLDLLSKNSKNQFHSLDELQEFNSTVRKEFEVRWRSLGRLDREAALQNLLRLRCIAIRPQPIDAHWLMAEVPRDRNSRVSFGDKWSYISAPKFEKVLNQILRQIWVAGGGAEYRPPKGVALSGFGLGGFGGQPMIEVPELNYHLTSLGKSLMIACSLDGKIIGENDIEEGEDGLDV